MGWAPLREVCSATWGQEWLGRGWSKSQESNKFVGSRQEGYAGQLVVQCSSYSLNPVWALFSEMFQFHHFDPMNVLLTLSSRLRRGQKVETQMSCSLCLPFLQILEITLLSLLLPLGTCFWAVALISSVPSQG